MIAWRYGKLPSAGTYLLVALLCGSLMRGAVGAPADVLATADPLLSNVPKQERAIERGDLSVAPQSGALTYTYPIPVPPGRLGAEPQISLAYSSHGAIYGDLAAHWTLSGVPSVRVDSVQSRTRLYEAQFDPAETRYVSSLAGGRELVRSPSQTSRAMWRRGTGRRTMEVTSASSG